MVVAEDRARTLLEQVVQEWAVLLIAVLLSLVRLQAAAGLLVTTPVAVLEVLVL